jgi:hypothetical protein
MIIYLSFRPAANASRGGKQGFTKSGRGATERGEVDLAGFDGRPRLNLALRATTIDTLRQQIASNRDDRMAAINGQQSEPEVYF